MRHPRRRHHAKPLGAVLVALTLAACGGGSPPGGAGDLPGEVPSGVAFEEPPDDALAAPELEVELVDGTPIRVSDLWADRPVVLVFTASWCERCAELHEDVADVVDDYDGAITLLGVAREQDEVGAVDYAETLQLGHPVGVADDRYWLAYAVEEPPLVALIAPGGRMLRGWPGGVDPGILAARIDDLVEQRS